jgi:hypothetical protein
MRATCARGLCYLHWRHTEQGHDYNDRFGYLDLAQPLAMTATAISVSAGASAPRIV